MFNRRAVLLGSAAVVSGASVAGATAIEPSAEPPVSPMALTPGGRLTLTAGTAITTIDVAGAATVYYTPCLGNHIPVYDGAAWAVRGFTELSLPLCDASASEGYHAAGALFDFFVFDNGGTLHLGTGPKWASATPGTSERGAGEGTTELEMSGGVWVNKNPLPLRFGPAPGDIVLVPARQATFVGTACMVANGLTEDSKTKRFLCNAYNRTERPLFYNASGHYPYSTAAWRSVGGSSISQVAAVQALSGDLIEMRSQLRFNSSGTIFRAVLSGIGLNTTAAPADTIATPGNANSTTWGHSTSTLSCYLPMGLNVLHWLEFGAGTDTQTVYHVSGLSGIHGSVFA